MICPYCNKEAVWVENKEVYSKNYGKSFMMWLCRACNAYVGCHNNTKEPLGTMANKELRAWRVKAHDIIDSYWKGNTAMYSRGEVYRKLSDHYGNQIHIGEADISLCKELVNGAEQILD